MLLTGTAAILCILVFAFGPISSAEDVLCMNDATQQVGIKTGESNPYRIMTHVKDSIGYTQDLKCNWNLRISNFQHTVQVLINVTTLDFAFVNRINEQTCSNRSDIFSMRFNGDIRVGSLQFSHIKWCSNWMALRTGEVIVFSMMNSHSSLTVQFKSAVRPDPADYIGETFRGVEFNAIALKANFCEHHLLFHKGWCYFITSRLVTFRQAWNSSHHATGELVAFDTPQEFTELFKANNKRGSTFPYHIPLDLNSNKRLWVGNFKGSDGKVYVTTSVQRCLDGPTFGFVKPTRQGSRLTEKAPPKACRFALNTSSQYLTCEDDNTLLPALIRFPLLSAQNRYEAMAYPCSPPRDAKEADTLLDADEDIISSVGSFNKGFQILTAGICLLVAVCAAVFGLLLVKSIRSRTNSRNSMVQTGVEDTAAAPLTSENM